MVDLSPVLFHWCSSLHPSCFTSIVFGDNQRADFLPPGLVPECSGARSSRIPVTIYLIWDVNLSGVVAVFVNNTDDRKWASHLYISTCCHSLTTQPIWTKLGSILFLLVLYYYICLYGIKHIVLFCIFVWLNIVTLTDFLVHCLKAVGMTGGCC